MSMSDHDVGEAARQKTMVPLGDALWHPNEQVERTETVVVRNSGIKEEMFLLYTTSENALGARVNGRILLAWDPDDTEGFEAGAFWVTEYGTKRLQSIYVAPLFRPQGGVLLAEALKSMGVKQTVGPYSPAGERYVDRHKFRKVSHIIRYRGTVYRIATQTTVSTAKLRYLYLAELAKHDNFRSAESAFHSAQRGLYWHITNDSDFAIDLSRGPRDMSSMSAGQSMDPGKLMVTGDLDHWANYYKREGRQYAALVDLSRLSLLEYQNVGRGFGSEFFVWHPEKATVVTTLPVARAKATDKRFTEKVIAHATEELRQHWEQARTSKQ